MHTETEYKKFQPPHEWRGGRAAFIGAHPDDLEFLGYHIAPGLISHGMTLSGFVATLGENGKYYGKEVKKDFLKRARRRELRFASREMGYRAVVARPAFADGWLKDHQDELDASVTHFVRKGGYHALFTFAQSEAERTYGFAHRDHRAVADAAAIASEIADTGSFYPHKRISPMEFRPHIFGFTTGSEGAWHQYHEVSLTEQDIRKQAAFMSRRFPSQFRLHILEPILRRIYSGRKEGEYRQLFFEVR